MSIGEVDCKINRSQLFRHQGVTFDPNLNLSHHPYEVTDKATKIFGILRRTFLFLTQNNILIIM